MADTSMATVQSARNRDRQPQPRPGLWRVQYHGHPNPSGGRITEQVVHDHKWSTRFPSRCERYMPEASARQYETLAGFTLHPPAEAAAPPADLEGLEAVVTPDGATATLRVQDPPADEDLDAEPEPDADEDAEPDANGSELDALTKVELLERATLLGLDVNARTRKQALKQAIMDAEQGAGAE